MEFEDLEIRATVAKKSAELPVMQSFQLEYGNACRLVAARPAVRGSFYPARMLVVHVSLTSVAVSRSEGVDMQPSWL